MTSFTSIQFGDNLTVTDLGSGVIRVDGAPVAATPSPDATTSVKGLVQLAGDLAGTAASPQIAAGAVGTVELAAAATPALVKLDAVTLGSAGFIGFSSIDQTYDDLLLRLFVRSNTTGAGGLDTLYFQVNADSTAKYSSELVLAQGTTVSAITNAAAVGLYIGHAPSTAAAASLWGVLTIEIIGYREAAYKHAVSHCYAPVGSAGGIRSHGGGEYWGSTSAITSLTFAASSSPNTLAAGSKATLYGRRG